jgi:hypothetical protein
MIGALLHYITHAEPATFQPMKAAMGLLPELEESVRNKRARYASYAEATPNAPRGIWKHISRRQGLTCLRLPNNEARGAGRISPQLEVRRR